MSRGVQLSVVDGHEHQIDIRLGPDRVVGQASAKNRRNDRAIPLDLLDKRIQRPAELLVDLHSATLADFG